MSKLLKLNKLLSVGIVLNLMLLSSCGFISDEPLEKEIYSGDSIALGCSSDLNDISFEDFLNKDIGDKLDCLNSNLEQFSKYVKVKNPDYIGSDELGQFIEQFFQSNSKNLLGAIQILFKINMLLLRDPEGQISRENLRLLFELLKTTNKEAVEITRVIGKISKLSDIVEHKNKDEVISVEVLAKAREEFWSLKQRLDDSVQRFSDFTLKVIQVKTTNAKRVNIKKFIQEINKNYDDINIDNGLIESFLFIKPLLLGGNREVLDSNEIIQLFKKIPKLLKYSFNFALVKDEYFENEHDHKSFNISSVNGLEQLLYKLPLELELFTMDQAITVINKAFNEDQEEDRKKVIALFKSFKYNIISNNDNFKMKDLRKVFLLSNSLLHLDKSLTYVTFLTKPLNESSSKEDVLKLKRIAQAELSFMKNILSEDLSNEVFPKLIRVKDFLFDIKKNTKVLKDFTDEELKIFLKFKPLLFAGKKGLLYKHELATFLPKINDFFNAYYTVKFESKLESNSELDSQKLITQLIKKAKSLLASLEPTRKLFNLYDIQTLVKKYVTEEDFKELRPILRSGANLKKTLYPVDKIVEMSSLTARKVRAYEAYYASNRLIEINREKFKVGTELAKIVNVFPIINIVKDANPYSTRSIDLNSEDNKSKDDSYMKDIHFSFNNIRTILDDVDAVVSMNYFNKITYSSMKEIMSLGTTLTAKNIKFKNLDGYKLFSKDELEILKNEFTLVATTFRYFRNDVNKSQFYGHKIKRSQKGFVELSQIYWALRKLMRVYGHSKTDISTNKSKYPYVLNKVQLDQLFLDLKPILVHKKLWSKNFSNFSRNAILLADLFQSISNGDTVLGAEEATEYGTLALSAMAIRDNVFMTLSNYCDPLNQDFESYKEITFDSTCARRNFFTILFDDLGYKDVLPNFYKYYKSESRSSLTLYQESIEGFARDNPDITLPMNYRDMILKIGAMLNVEAVFVRYDTCNEESCFDNILDNAELEKAFAVYENAILTISKLPASLSFLGESIFLYMLKKMKKPTKTALIFFHSNPFGKTVKARRLNIGTLLYYMVQEANEKAKLNRQRIYVHKDEDNDDDSLENLSEDDIKELEGIFNNGRRQNKSVRGHPRRRK